MKKIYHLSTCDTNRRILKEWQPSDEVELQDIKTNKITPEQIDEMASLSGSFESLFSRRSRSYKAMGLADKTLSEQDYRDLILSDYTFLKRPVLIVDDQIFIGNAKANVEAAAEALK